MASSPTVTGLARLEQVVAVDAHEGPVHDAAEDVLYFTTVPRDGRVAIKRLHLDSGRIEVVRADANMANGMTADGPGRLLVCEQGGLDRPARIARLHVDTGETETVVDAWRGRRLNSPNDIVVRSDGSVWFTDPSYGHLQGFRPEPETGDHVYRFDPLTGSLDVAASGGLDKPNGLAFSPDESVLYVGDSGANHEPGSFDPARPHHVLAYDVLDGCRLGEPRLFCVVEPGFPDGIKVDSAGRVYVSCFSGVQVFDPDGTLLGEIALPGAVNFAWGGQDSSLLFITADTAIWCAALAATGPTIPKGARP